MTFLAGMFLLILANILFFPLKITVIHKFEDIEIRGPQKSLWTIWQKIDEDED